MTNVCLFLETPECFSQMIMISWRYIPRLCSACTTYSHLWLLLSVDIVERGNNAHKTELVYSLKKEKKTCLFGMHFFCFFVPFEWQIPIYSFFQRQYVAVRLQKSISLFQFLRGSSVTSHPVFFLSSTESSDVLMFSPAHWKAHKLVNVVTFFSALRILQFLLFQTKKNPNCFYSFSTTDFWK